MAWYRSGTVALTNGNTEVVGTGTQFLNNVKAGDIFIGPDGLLYEIASVNTSTEIILQIGYAGVSVNGATYEIVPTTINLKQLAQRVADLIALYNEIPQDVSDSQDAAAASAAAAAASQSAAATSEVNAASSATSASTAASQLAAALLTFNKLWLGPHGSDPTTDNNGEALQEGAMYENTSTTPAKIRIYHNGEWQNYSADAEAATAAAQLSATNAAASEANAASSASAAATSATEASDSASAAATSAEVAHNATSGKMDKSANLSDVADVPTARANLKAAASGTNSDINELTGLTTALSVGQGGTGLSSQGTAGQVLASGGSGKPMTWVNPADSTSYRMKNRIVNSTCSRYDTAALARNTPDSYGPVNFRHSFSRGGFTVSQGKLTYKGVDYATCRMTATADFGTVGSTDLYGIVTVIECSFCYDLVDNAFVAAFVMNASVAGTYGFSFRDANSTATSIQSYVDSFTYAQANTPQLVVLKIPANSALYLPNSTTTRAVITLGLVSGASYQIPTKTWTKGNYIATVGLTNWAQTANNFIEFTLVHVEKGEDFTGFEIVPPAINDIMCNRYSQLLDSISWSVSAGGGGNTSSIMARLPIKPTMRARAALAHNYGTANFRNDGGGPVAGQWALVIYGITYVGGYTISSFGVDVQDTMVIMYLNAGTQPNGFMPNWIAAGSGLYVIATSYL